MSQREQEEPSEELQGQAASKGFALGVRISLFLLLAGYALDLVLSQYLLPTQGLDASMVASTLPPPEDPYGMVSFLSLAGLVLGHLILAFSSLFFVLGYPDFFARLKEVGRYQVVLLLGGASLLGFLTLLGEARYINTHNLTYGATLAWDMVTIISLSAGGWMGLARQGRTVERKSLAALGLCAVVTGLTALGMNESMPWLVLVFGSTTTAGTILALQLLGGFASGPAAEREEAPGDL